MSPRRSLLRLSVIAALGLLACLLPAWGTPVAAGIPEPIVVNSTGDEPDLSGGSGPCDTDILVFQDPCTLRAAIQTANVDPDEDTIVFAIGGSGVRRIEPPTALPVITNPLIIKGYSQPGTSANTATKGTNANLRIVLDGNGVSFDGLESDARLKVRGLVIHGFNFGIDFNPGAGGSVVAGNFIGTDVTGTSAAGNSSYAVVAEAPNVTVGGPRLKDRNLIAANGGGIHSPVDIGRLKVQGNLIGVAADGSTPLGNGTYGLSLHGAGGGLIGGNSVTSQNVIAYSEYAGIIVHDVVLQGHRFTVARNSIYANGGLGIDLGGDGVTPNDGAPDADDGPNGLQNFPGIGSVKTVTGTTTIKGTLRSTPSRTFDLRFYSTGAGSGGGEGRVFLMKRAVTTNGNGRVDFTFVTPDKVAIGRVITSTATDRTSRNTSEFSVARAVTGP